MSWRLHVDAKTPENAAKVASRVSGLVGDRLAVERIEPYWKLEGQQVVSCSLALRAHSLAEAVVEALVVAGQLAGEWHVSTPEDAADGWHFDGWASGDFRVAGIEFATWTLAHLPSEAPDAA